MSSTSFSEINTKEILYVCSESHLERRVRTTFHDVRSQVWSFLIEILLIGKNTHFTEIVRCVSGGSVALEDLRLNFQRPGRGIGVRGGCKLLAQL